MEADSTQHKMLKAKKRRNSSTSVSSMTSDSNSTSSSGSTSSSSSSSSVSSHERRRGKKKSRTSKVKKVNSKPNSGSEDELDLTKELLPISGYVKTKDVMLQHMFKSISKKKLKAMLPSILKTVPLNKLKKMCLEQLEVMSKKRIYRTLAGEDADAISSSGTDESTDDASQINNISQKPDLLQNIELNYCPIVTESTNISEVKMEVEDRVNSDSNEKDNDLEDSQHIKNNSDTKNTNSDVYNSSCDESVPSSLPDLESEPDIGNEIDDISNKEDNKSVDSENDENKSSPSSTPNNDNYLAKKNIVTDNAVKDMPLSIQDDEETKVIEITSSTDIVQNDSGSEVKETCEGHEQYQSVSNETQHADESDLITNTQNDGGSDLFTNLDINAMIMKVEDQEFIDEDIEEAINGSTNDTEKKDSIIREKMMAPSEASISNIPDSNDCNSILLSEKTNINDKLPQLEILELEMRARAIKAMIKAQENSKHEIICNKKEKSTDCDSALIPLPCVHG